MSTHTPRTAGRDFYPEPRLLDVAAMAELLGTSERMPRRLIAERRLPVVKVGRHVRVWSDDLAAYLESSTRPANGAA
jgi:excisionase family DNA binding protein